MKTINLTKEYRFATEIFDEGFRYELTLSEEGNLITLRRVDSEFEREDYVCAQGTLPVLKELVTSIICYYFFLLFLFIFAIFLNFSLFSFK